MRCGSNSPNLPWQERIRRSLKKCVAPSRPVPISFQGIVVENHEALNMDRLPSDTKILPAPASVQSRVRRTFVAGIFATAPLAVTAFIIWWIDAKTRGITFWLFHREIPLLGVLIALLAIYGTGMITSSLIGKFVLRIVDAVLVRLPVIRQLYTGWKQIALTPGGTEGMFSRVVLIPDETGVMKMLGFTNGRVIEADMPSYCVFVPSAPNPVTGRLYFVQVDRCQIIDMTADEAFKIVLSTGNYVPPLIELAPAEPAAAGSAQVSRMTA